VVAFANNVLRERIQGAPGCVGVSGFNCPGARTGSALNVDANARISVMSFNAPVNFGFSISLHRYFVDSKKKYIF